MRKMTFVAALSLLLPTMALAQTMEKSLAFAQVAVGGSSPEILETILNLTNRGTTTYNGTLNLFTMSNNSPQPWSPIVNGDANAVTNGEMAISLNAGNTTTLTLTGGATLAVGFATITPTGSSSTDETSFVEGTLTYYFMNGTASTNITNSVGISPSDALYLTTIPFDNFNNIALALANTNATTASVNLLLYSAENVSMGNQTLTIPTNGHVAEYLSEIFTNVTMTGARLDIDSDTSIVAVAVTDVNSQFSSLPLLPSVKTFNWTIDWNSAVGTESTRGGTVSFRFYNSQGESQSTILTKNGNPVANPHSNYVIGTFSTSGYGSYTFDPTNNEVTHWQATSLLSFSSPVITGTAEIWGFDGTTFTYKGEGTLTLTATN